MFRLVSTIVILFLFSSLAQANQCRDMLSYSNDSAQTTNCSSDTCKSHKNNEKSHQHQNGNKTTDKVIGILDSMKSLGVITDEHYYHHAREDLEATASIIEEKLEHKIFKTLFEKWAVLIDKATLQIEKFKELSDEDKQIWQKKLEIVGKFIVSQYVTFAMAEGKFKPALMYKKQNQILIYMNSLPDSINFKIFSFELEKQLKRFFSVSEIIKCKF